ncbi:3-hydroxyacyl-CoA dehydrogenase family protein [Streptomyces clavuligerus]|uniref:Methoxymalonate biosynthesis 3-hydroxyacyl-CoA dehydrogenase n=1 Tax=Streptomyces clavuligerus TaxID=1901 RepID=B5H3E0_STRCL|nr:3-hydroxyacyl-CoA dehydrogenase family protein [Streptomyces clavuligerus]ANW21719.1 3-hydroxyacyl-CoA dehydrogenase [Streptomyces clavuligerus]AXU16352.1 3-hydroxyacyl-CoA dehydrogenase family protein [Streptomyces clavuligerus]EDY53086.1 methoxymalonate biosynthesis protein [Streptomyces clavuligerus]EFG05086.1 Methoxymalonate biosynthesis 3-hydroxyacyl-CoA dehydrogenase [Streptomyces clavuligerus]MBY6306514.1 3-hydroxyacyl-CoA dehydrogenase family protein [Streptomyces clavuligerus]
MTRAPHKDTSPSTPRRIAVLGAGVMGVGITALALSHGLPVLLVDPDPAQLGRARARIGDELRMAQLMGHLPAAADTAALDTAAVPDGVSDATAVIEAITEDTALKARVLTEISARVRPGTPLITNTSSIPVGELAGHALRPGDVVGTHFMNPPYLIPTVEVIRGPRTSEVTMAAVGALLGTLGRRQVVVRDAPGFVTSRVLHPMINDAARVVQEGTASAEAVDALMEGCLGHPTGPLRTADLIGIDNLVDSLRVLHERTGDDGCRPCDLLLDKVRHGLLGRKSGRGFYDYQEEN